MKEWVSYWLSCRPLLLTITIALLLSDAVTAWSQTNATIDRHADAVLREDCFAIETLPTDLQKLSKKMLLEALDSEALYTIVGNLKPVSEGYHSFFIETEKLDKAELERIEQALTAWKCGDCFEAGILPFDHLFDGKRYVSAWIANRKSLTEKIKEESDWFARMGLTENASTQAVLLAIERSSSMEDRWRGFGILFGYPKPAIDFFVRAGVHRATTGEFVERDFRNFPTHQGATGGFVYAVPKLSEETESELAIRHKVDAILTLYRGLRDRRVVNDNPEQVVELIRDLFDDGAGWCHPNHALQKANQWARARSWVVENAIQLAETDPDAGLQEMKNLDSFLATPRIVALGESTHGTREFFQMKHRVFRYLAESHGVRLFGIESSFAACMPINRYIQTGNGDVKKLIKEQGFWTWDTDEVLQLVQWMRRWNADPRNQDDRLFFYGFDTQDAYTPINFLLEELGKYDADDAQSFRNDLSNVLTSQYDPSYSPDNEETNRHLETIAGIKASLQRSAGKRSQAENVAIELAIFQAQSALEIDRPKPGAEPTDSPPMKTNVRDRTMAEMVAKILDAHGESSRIVLWAHDWHISKLAGDPVKDFPRMGTFLERRYQDDYLPVGFSFGSGKFQAKYFPGEGEDSSTRILRAFNLRGSRYDSFSNLFDRVDAPVFALDLRENATETIPQWFRQRQFNRTIGAIFQPSKAASDSYYEHLVLSQHYEVVIHVKKTKAAVPLSPVPKVWFGAKFEEKSEVSTNRNSDTSNGARVLSVAENSLAESCGLEPGDRIVKFGDKAIASEDDFRQALSELKRGGTFEMGVTRQPDTDQSRPVTLFVLVPATVADKN